MAAGGNTGETRDVSSTTALGTGRFPSPAPFFDGCPGLFIQTTDTEAALRAAAPLVRQEGMGTVVTMGRVRDHVRRLRDLAQLHHDLVGPLDHVMFDASRYSGKNRVIGAATLDAGWVAAQRRAGVRLVLTDSPYLPAGHRQALISTLAQGKELGEDVVVVLPLHLDWLIKDTEVLIEAINTAGLRVVLVLEHVGDPLSVQAAVAGLVRLLDASEVKVGLLRCDLSVLGALAFGASLGAVGTSTGLRHIYPTGNDEDGFGRAASIAALVPQTMGYRTLDKLNAGISADPDHQDRWRCACRFCHDRTLDWIASDEEAAQHSLAATAILGERILHGLTPAERQHAWVNACTHAQFVNLEIEADTGITWKPPAYLAGWHKLSAILPPLTPSV